jgi:membrane protein DedA with SNARE-associated domain
VSVLSDVGDQLLAWMMAYGYPILFLTLFVAAVGLPLPSGLIAAVAGALVASGSLELGPTLAIALAACMLGDLSGYAIGRWGGNFAARHGRWLGASNQRLSQAQTIYQRWAAPTLLLSRSLVAIIGPAINVLAGLSRQSLASFGTYDALGRLAWVILYVGLGFVFAGSVQAAADLAGSLGGLLGVLGIAVVLWLGARRPSRPVQSAGC